MKSLACGLHTDEPDPILQKGVKKTNRIASASDTRHQKIGKRPRYHFHLFFRFKTDYGLKISDNHGIRVRSHSRTQKIMSCIHVRYPIPDGFICRVFKGSGTGMNGNDAGAQELHFINIQGLTFHVLSTHKHIARQAEESRSRSGRHAMLTGARFGDNSFLAEIPGQKPLTNRVVDFVGDRKSTRLNSSHSSISY